MSKTANPKKPIVGISQGVVYLVDRNERRDFVDQKLIEIVADIGCLPVMVPNVINKGDDDELAYWLDEMRVGALLLSGGADIGLFPERDRTETRLLRWAEEFSRPVLGVCRGMQKLNHIFWCRTNPVESHVGVRHVICNWLMVLNGK